ncbi:MAG: MFS transporter, partial [Terriglobales bacterium]
RSPRWLVMRNRIDEARSVLKLVGVQDYEKELQGIVDNIQKEHSQKKEPLFQKKYAFAIFLAIAVGAFNQLSGINAILYYLNDIFGYAGYSKMSGDVQAVIIGATNLVATLTAMSLIDRIGRKTLLLIGAVGTTLCLGGIAAIFHLHQHMELLVWLLVAYIAFFAFSQGAVIWVYVSEIFPTPVRAKGQSVGSSTHWIMNAFISGLFPILAGASGAGPFVFFAAMMALQFVVVLRFFPETKGITLEDMEQRILAH